MYFSTQSLLFISLIPDLEISGITSLGFLSFYLHLLCVLNDVFQFKYCLVEIFNY